MSNYYPVSNEGLGSPPQPPSDRERELETQLAGVREQLEVQKELLRLRPTNTVYLGAEAAEAKLAEVERRLEGATSDHVRSEARLAEVEKDAKHWHEKCGETCARLREVEEERDKTEEYAKEGWDWLSEALDALGAKTVFDIKARAASKDRARDTAGRSFKPHEGLATALARLRLIDRLLSGDE